MGIRPNSYGSVAEVEALTKRYTSSGSYGTTTNPTLAQVEQFLDRVSGIANVVLAEQGFSIPVTQADAALAIADFVVGQAALLVEAANGHGLYAPGSQSVRGTTPMRLVIREAEAFFEAHAVGLELLGATRSRRLTDGLACRETDGSGAVIEPWFKREMLE